MMAQKDQELLQQIQQPEQKAAAFDRLVLQYQEMIYFHIRRMVIDHDDANDVVQNTFLKAWRALDKFRGEASLKTWLYRIATNEAINFLNQKRKERKEEVSNVEDDLRHSLHGGRLIEGDEIQMKLQEAILTLPERQRLVFNMRYFEEMAYAEMAEILEVSVGGLKANYHHAVKKIEQYLQAHF